MFIEVTDENKKILMNTDCITKIEKDLADTTSIYFDPHDKYGRTFYSVEESYEEIKALLECNDLILHKKIKGI